MTTNDRTQGPNKSWRLIYAVSDRWVSDFVDAISHVITSGVAVAITAFTIVFVVLGGLWLAYTYLPLNAFTIIAVVLGADILIGIAVRAYVKRR